MDELELFPNYNPTEWINKYVEPDISKADRVRKMTRQGHPSTSYLAAETVLKNMTKRMRETLDVFESVAPRGLIGEELDRLAQDAGMKPGAAPKRIRDLEAAKEIVWTGEYRLTTSGCKAKVWYKA